MAAHDTVQVAVRVRPLNEAEISKGGQIFLDVHEKESQIILKTNNQGYTFNYVFPDGSKQQDVYDTAVKELLNQLFKGYNVTVLAYGQTGSGKTYTMGTDYIPGSSHLKGIIPLAIEDIFRKIDSDDEWEYSITASFIELYQEQVFDLLTGRSKDSSILDIREDTRGVYIPNLTEKPISSVEETFIYLQQGSLYRATGATAMNAQSSRSHAIFTISLNFNKKDNVDEAMTAKFHLVDLAGSERYKKTKTSGERFKEGININKGLLVLGNVISALGDGNHSHISYRDSKLTRLLQDSLGGNSQTLMIACVSQSEYNQDETASTLRYADRARRIKNRPVINQDPKVVENAKLKKENEQLREEVMNLKNLYQKGFDSSNRQSGDGDINLCSPDHQLLHVENIELKSKIRDLIDTITTSYYKNNILSEKALIVDKAREYIKEKLVELDTVYSQLLEKLTSCSTNLPEISLEKFYGVQLKIRDLLAELKKNEEDILNHVMNGGSINTSDYRSCNDSGTSNYEVQISEKHLVQQAELSSELQNLTKNLAFKEDLIKQLAETSDREPRCLEDPTEHMKDLQEHIITLQNERDELSEQIRKMHANNAGNKLAEQRRKKLQELELKITALNKKVTEQTRIIKMKEKSEEKITHLKSEILAMKQTKVRLIQQMKSESEKFRVIRLTRERELCKLREQDRRHHNQILRMEVLHKKQQNVLKRKVEEASSINKKLKDALAVKKVAQERLSNTNKTEHVVSWLDQELEVLVRTAEAERTIEELKKDHNCLNEELLSLKNVSTIGMSVDDKFKLSCSKESLARDIELRSTQIADMQQKITDSIQESKWKSYVDQLHSLMDAKNTIKHLFIVAMDAKKCTSHKEHVLKEISETCTDLKVQLTNYKERCIELKEQNENKLQKIEEENQEKVCLLLNQLSKKDSLCNSSDSYRHLLERIKIQSEEMEKMNALRLEVKRLSRTIERLTKESQTTKKRQVLSQEKSEEFNKENVFLSPKFSSKIKFDDDRENLIFYNINNTDQSWYNTTALNKSQDSRNVFLSSSRSENSCLVKSSVS